MHICSNETIGGVEYHWTPDIGDVPLVADMSSNILSRPVDVSKYGLIYGGAQKNIGPAGLTIVIVRDDLIGQALPITPSAFDYKQQADNDSMSTRRPPTRSTSPGWCSSGSRRKAAWRRWKRTTAPRPRCCTTTSTPPSFYSSPVAKADRSLMNVPFKLKDESLDAAFLKGAEARHMLQLKGHRSVGGMRASIYNAMPIEGVQGAGGLHEGVRGTAWLRRSACTSWC